MDWDDAYANGIHIPGGADYPARWQTEAARFRDEHPSRTAGRSRLFTGQGGGLVVFIHGGYWHETAPDLWSHLAGGALALGASVLMPAYTLAPAAPLAAMPAEIAAAIHAAAAEVRGPIVLTGHSAGGHLAARLICDDNLLSPAIRARLRLCLPISGLFDLRPLRRTAMNTTLRLTAAEARAESPAFHRPLPGIPVIAWVGGAERPEFLRQSRLIAARWRGQARAVIDPGRHHFDVIEGLCDPASPLMAPVAAALS